jgi:hypothetical protein
MNIASLLLMSVNDEGSEVVEDSKDEVRVKKFSIEEMDEILYMATVRAEARAELRLAGIDPNEDESD